jgi:hypothetical protein
MSEGSRDVSLSVDTTSIPAMNMVAGKVRRKQWSIQNTSAAAVVSIRRGDSEATAGEGLNLLPNGVTSESNDNGYKCWQGPIQIVSDVAGTVAVSEVFIIDD